MILGVDQPHSFHQDANSCLQLLQNSSGLYLRVATDTTNWMISDSIDDGEARIESGSAGAMCPAHPSNAVSDRFGRTNWVFDDGKGGFPAGDVAVKCLTHSW